MYAKHTSKAPKYIEYHNQKYKESRNLVTEKLKQGSHLTNLDHNNPAFIIIDPVFSPSKVQLLPSKCSSLLMQKI